MSEMPVVGVTGWKNSGKTTLVERLVAELTNRDFKISTVKHAHHNFEIDHEGTDSFRHRAAGAREVIISSSRRNAQIQELEDQKELQFEEIIARLAPCDLVIVEGYKKENFPKLEVRRQGSSKDQPLNRDDYDVIAVVSDKKIDDDIKQFDINDINNIANFLIERVISRKNSKDHSEEIDPPSAPDINNCYSADRNRLKHHDAIEILKSNMSAVCEFTDIKLEEASGRILSEDIIVPQNVPFTDNSAVDGYAFSHHDYISLKGELEVSDRITAKPNDPATLKPGTASRIFTGAVMPANTDTVVMQEDVTLSDNDKTIDIPAGLKTGANRRKSGEDLKKGDLLLGKGKRLNARDLAAIASIGKPNISCFQPLRVALMSTGDELVRPGAVFTSGNVYDANHYLLKSMLESLRFRVTDIGIIEDDPQLTKKTISELTNTHDVIISSGGASKGEEDYIIDTVGLLGKLAMWQMAVKPGRPMGFGKVSNTNIFILPGNPVAAFVCFLLYVKPSLDCLAGADWTEPKSYKIPSNFELKKKPNRREFLRGILTTNEQGQQVLVKYPRDGSGLISSLREADGLINISEEITRVSKGDLLDFTPFSEWGVS